MANQRSFRRPDERAERSHDDREQREVLELVMAVLGAVQRFGLKGAHGRLAPGNKVDHLVLDARDVGDDGEDDERKNDQPAGVAASCQKPERSRRTTLMQSPSSAAGRGMRQSARHQR